MTILGQSKSKATAAPKGLTLCSALNRFTIQSLTLNLIFQPGYIWNKVLKLSFDIIYIQI